MPGSIDWLSFKPLSAMEQMAYVVTGMLRVQFSSSPELFWAHIMSNFRPAVDVTAKGGRLASHPWQSKAAEAPPVGGCKLACQWYATFEINTSRLAACYTLA